MKNVKITIRRKSSQTVLTSSFRAPLKVRDVHVNPQKSLLTKSLEAYQVRGISVKRNQCPRRVVIAEANNKKASISSSTTSSSAFPSYSYNLDDNDADHMAYLESR